MGSVPDVVAPWLVGSDGDGLLAKKPAPNVAFVPTHIKQLKTTAPKDMRDAKASRQKGRADAKQRNKEGKNTTVEK